MSSESLAQAVARNSNWINTVISNSKLSSQLSELVSITSLDQKIVVQEGVLDAKYANVKSIRGYKGLWNATTNIPTLSNSSGVVGDVYKVSVAGNINIGSGSIYYVVGDLIYLSEDNWIKISPNQISDITGLQLALDSLAGGLIPQGNWNALSNVPDIGTGATTGQFWIVSVAGSTNVGGITDWEVNDWAVRTATGWAKIDNTDKVLSVAGRTGVIVLGITDITGLTAELANTVKLTGNQSIAGQKTFTELVTMTDRLKLSDSAANTLIGDGVGTSLTTGAFNVGVGFNVLQDNTVGTYNVGLGDLALHQNTEGSNNFAGGTFSMWTNSTGSFNVAIGFEASRINTTGSFNVAIGSEASKTNTTGENNIGIGKESLWNNRTGSHNIGVGLQAGKYIANGVGDNRIPQKSIFIGQDTRANADGQTNQIVIGDTAIGNGSNTVTLGNNSIATTYLKGDVNITGSITGGGGDFLPLAGGTLTGALTGTSASFVGNVITDGIFKVDSAPDNNILEVTQSGRKMALKTSFAGDAVGSFWAFRVSNGNVNGSTTDALIVKPQQATFAGNVQLKGTTPTLEFFKTSAGDVLANIKVESGVGTGGKLTIQTKRNGNTPIDALVIDNDQNATFGGNVTITGTGDKILDIYRDGGSNHSIRLHSEGVSWINNNNNFGIGTTSPNNKLSVQVGTDSRMEFWGGSTYAAMQSVNDANTALKIMRFDASAYYFVSGNVGIGTTNPRTKLEVGGSGTLGAVTNKVISATFDGGYSTTNSLQYNVNAFIGTTFGTTDIFASTGGETDKNFYTGLVSGNSYFNGSRYSVVQGGAERLTVARGGNVGIGTTTPDYRLEVNAGNGIFVGDGGAAVLEANSSTGLFKIGDTDELGDGVYITNNTGGNLDMYSSGSIRVRMDVNGKFMIGTTSATSNANLTVKESLAIQSGSNTVLSISTAYGGAFINTGTSGGTVNFGLPSSNTTNVFVQGTIEAASSVQMGNNTAAASAANAGSTRYRVSGNNSYMDMSMRTGATSYAWVNIVQNNW